MIKSRFLLLFPPDFCSANWKSAIRNAQCAILLGAMLFALCVTVEAQQAKKVYRVGYLAASLGTATEPREEAFLKGLRELGYVQGQNIVIERRVGSDREEHFSKAAVELASLKVDCIVTGGTAGTLAATSGDQIAWCKQ